MGEKELVLEIKNPKLILLSLFLVIMLILQLDVTLHSPISFGDEGFHTRMAQWISENVEYPVWVPFTQNNLWKSSYSRQPFWNFLEAGLFYLLGFSEVLVKALTPIIAILTGIATYILGKKFYNENMGFFSSVILISLPSFVTYSVLFYTDMLVTFFMTMFILTLMIAAENKKRLYMLAAGTFGALTFMTKLTGYASYVLLLFVLMYEITRKKNLLQPIKTYFPVILMMVLIPSTFLIRSYAYYNTPVCYGIPIISPITDKLFNLEGCDIDEYSPEYSYEGRNAQTGSDAGVFTMGLINYLGFAYGSELFNSFTLWIILITFFSGMMMFWNRMKNTEESRLIDFTIVSMMLIFFVLFTTITKRAEDTARFSLMWAPIIALIASQFISSLYDIIKIHQKHVTIGIFILVFAIAYINAMPKFITMVQVKQFSPTFFEACDWIKENTHENILISTVWTYRTAYCSQRTVTGSEPDMALSGDVNKILETANELGITHIFIQKFSLSNNALSESYPISYVKLLESNPEHFKTVYENGPSLNECISAGGCDGNIVFEIIQ